MQTSDTSHQEVEFRPKSLSELFWALSFLALQGFGGIFPIAHRVFVEERKWFTSKKFLEDWAVAQVLPGPNVVNLSVMIGARYFGFKGGLVAIAGIFGFPSIVLVLIAIFFDQFSSYPFVAGALKGMGAVSAGLIAGTSLKLAQGIKGHPIGTYVAFSFTFVAFLLIALFHVSLIYILLTLGLLCIYLTFKKLTHVRDLQ